MPTRLRVFFGAVKTKRSNTVKSKIANYVKKEDQLRKSIFSKSARKVVVRLENATLKSMISEEGASFNCDIGQNDFRWKG